MGQETTRDVALSLSAGVTDAAAEFYPRVNSCTSELACSWKDLVFQWFLVYPGKSRRKSSLWRAWSSLLLSFPWWREEVQSTQKGLAFGARSVLLCTPRGWGRLTPALGISHLEPFGMFVKAEHHSAHYRLCPSEMPWTLAETLCLWFLFFLEWIYPVLEAPRERSAHSCNIFKISSDSDVGEATKSFPQAAATQWFASVWSLVREQWKSGKAQPWWIGPQRELDQVPSSDLDSP